MKKQLLTICCIVFISISSKAQFDTIPNAGFEDWYLATPSTIAALSWQNNNSSIAAWNVMPDSISHSGILSLRLEKVSYRGVTWSGFLITQHPLALEGYVKNGLGIGDTALIYIHIYSSNILVDSGYAEIYGGIGSNFLPFYVSISQNTSAADSCVIILAGGNQFGSVIWYDDLTFAFSTSVEEHQYSAWNIFPNPCSDRLFISGIKENSIVTLRDISGKIIREEKLSSLDRVIDIQSVPAGVYLVGIAAEKERGNYLIMKN